MIHQLFNIIKDRKANPQEGSYTNKLFTAGEDKILQKVGEESIEVLIAAANQSEQRLIEETSDLIYHLWVLLVSKGIELSQIEAELEQRHK